MKRYNPWHALVRFFSTVRTRLTLWYLAVVMVIMFIFGGSLYASQMVFNANTAESRLETQLYQDTQRLENSYKQTLLVGQSPAAQKLTLSENEIVLLLRPDGTILDRRGPLTSEATQQLLSRAENGQTTVNITIPQSSSTKSWHSND